MKGDRFIASRETREILLTILCGVIGCLAATGFSSGIDHLYALLWTPLQQHGIWMFAGVGFVILTATGLITGWMLASLAPTAAGSGIPQLKVSYWLEGGRTPAMPVIVKFLAGIISIGGGLSLGKEGPVVYMAAGASSLIGRRLSTFSFQSRSMEACGAAAGLAAAFNSPIAGVTFVLEEVLGNLNSRLIGRLLLASFVSVFFLYLILGDRPALILPKEIPFDWPSYLLVPPVSALAALVGVSFQTASLGWRKRIHTGSRIPRVARPLIGALLTWAAASIVFAFTGHAGVLGLGYGDLNCCLAGTLGMLTLALLLLGKWIATTASYSWGGCGGIFSPTLCLGGFTGALVAGLAAGLFHLTKGSAELLAVVGMSACLGAVVRAPITSIMIVFEMTHSFALMPPLMLGALISQYVSRRACRDNFYSQVLRDDGISIPAARQRGDFAEWKSQAVGGLAVKPVRALMPGDPEGARLILQESPFARYPVIAQDYTLQGIVSREGCLQALDSGQPWPIHPATSLGGEATLEVVEKLLMDAPLGLVIIQDHSREIRGIFTMNDLLRCQLPLMDSA